MMVSCRLLMLSNWVQPFRGTFLAVRGAEDDEGIEGHRGTGDVHHHQDANGALAAAVCRNADIDWVARFNWKKSGANLLLS